MVTSADQQLPHRNTCGRTLEITINLRTRALGELDETEVKTPTLRADRSRNLHGG